VGQVILAELRRNQMAGIRGRLGLPPTPKFDSETFTRFVEILFAIVIGQSFFLLSAPQRFPTWIRAWTDNVVPLLNTILAYTLVVTSWLGYHESVKKQPLRRVPRFAIDVGLLFLYYLAFVYVDSSVSFLLILVVIFFGYTVWTLIRIYEYRKVNGKDPEEGKEVNPTGSAAHALSFLVAFLVVYGFLWWLSISSQLPRLTEIGFVLLALVLLGLYRWSYPYTGVEKAQRPASAPPPQ